MKIKKVRQKRSPSVKLLARYRNSYKNLSAIEINSIKRVETNGFLTQQNLSKYCSVSHHKASIPSELYLKYNTLPEDSSEQWQLPLSHGESNAVALSSLTSVIQPEKEDINLYILDQSTKDNVDPFFSSKLEDLIQSISLLKLNCIESSIDQETCEKNVHQKDSHTPEPISVIDSAYSPTAVSDLDTVTSAIGEIDQFDESNFTTGSTFATEYDKSTTDAPFNESDLTKEVNFTQDAGIDQISSPTQETNPSEKVGSLDDYIKKHLFLSYEQVVPDDSDPDFYCRVCKMKSKDKASFYKHLTENHKMILRPFSDWRTQDIVTGSHEEVPKSYCSKCDLAFTENNAYLEHFSDTMFHKFDAKGIDIYKSTFYQCDKCPFTRKGMFSFYRHYKKVHKVALDIMKYSPQQSLANIKANSTSKKSIKKLDRNNAKIKGGTDTTESSSSKEKFQLKPVNKAKTKRVFTTKNSIRRSTRIQNEKAQTKTESKRRKPRAQKLMVTENSKRNTRATNVTSRRPAKINPRRICQFCNKVLSTPTACKGHIERKHKAASTSESVESVFILPEKSVTKRNTRATNVTSRRPVKINPRRVCQFCNKVLSTPTACKGHIERKHKAVSTNESVESISTLSEKNDINIKCVVCDKIYSSKELLYTHFKNTHKTEATGRLCIANKLYCKLCDIEFPSSLDLEKHMRKSHHLIRDKKERGKCYCAVCNMVFKSAHGHNRHIVSKPHTENTLALKKIIAVASNGSHISLEETSTEVEEEVNIPRYKNPRNIEHCNACNITFYNKSSSLMHFFKIHKFKYIEAPEKKVYKRKPNLNMLLKNEPLPKENDPNLYCNVCRKKFCNEGNFKLHLVSIHKMVLKKDKPNPAESNASGKTESIGTDCSKKFVSAKASQEHLLRLHRAEKRKTGLSVSNDKTAKRSRATNIT